MNWAPRRISDSAPNDSRRPLISLASNENPYGPSPKAIAAVSKALGHSNFYPDDNADELQDKLAAFHGVRPEQVLVGAGSTELINIIARSLLGPGSNAVTSERSFIAYSIATVAAGAELVQVPMADDSFDLDGLSKAITRATRLVFLANPNNPTGTLFDANATVAFLESLPARVVVVLDEAYYEYADYFAARRGIHYSHALDYVREGREVVVLRTFSKVHGLAGLRVGYALGKPDLLARFARMRTTYSISTPAQAGAIAALGDSAHIQSAIAHNAAGVQWLTDALSELGFRTIPSWANFIYCEIGTDADEFANRMEAEGVSIRSLRGWGAPTAIRVSIGTTEQNQAFLKAVKKVRESGH